MKALPTQFDDHRLSNAVATPTCSSCCCCCCCLATTFSSSSLLAQRVHKEAKAKNLPHGGILTAIAALFLPIVGLIVYLLVAIVNNGFADCRTVVRSYGSYELCSSPGNGLVIPLLIIVPVLVLAFLYNQVSIKHPWRRAILITLLIAIAFIVEAIAGAAAILTGVGGIIYLVLVPFMIGFISRWYYKHLRKDLQQQPQATQPMAQAPVTNGTAAPITQHEENNDKPPQSQPPTEEF